ncbi:MAG: NUDIX hydrolase [Bacteroidota bacterium]
MPIPSWEKIKERIAYDGWRSMLVKTFRLPDGQVQEYDVVRNGAYVVVAAFTKEKEAILIQQYRPGPEMVLSSFCEGYIDENETPEQAAARELLEETGYRAGSIKLLRTLRTAYSTEKRICLLALDCEYERPPAGDADEFIEVFTMPMAEFLAWVSTDESAFYTLDALLLALQAEPSLQTQPEPH